MKKNIIEAIRTHVEAQRTRSAWQRGVKAYAFDLLDDLDEAIEYGNIDLDDLASPKLLTMALLNGADGWASYSWGGSSLIYDRDIAERLCCPSDFKRSHEGQYRPNKYEEWLDTQARALTQASRMICRIAAELTR